MQPALDDVIAALARHRQRATYGAVAGCVGGTARDVMAGRPKNPRNGWLVSEATGLLTGYAPGERDPGVAASGPPISDAVQLQAWLRAAVNTRAPRLNRAAAPAG